MSKVFDFLGVLTRMCLYLFVFFMPFQVKTLLYSGAGESGLLFSGFFNPYLSHFLYLSDVFFILALLFWCLGLFSGFKLKNLKLGDRWILGALLLWGGAYFLAWGDDFWNSMIYALRFLEFGVFYLFLVNKVIDWKRLAYVLIASLSFVALIGIGQYVLQESLGLGFVGEPLVSADSVEAARFAFGDVKVLRAYGTFPHPNVFGGYLLFGVFFIAYFLKRKGGRKAGILLWLALALCFVALLMTFSRSAWLALFLGGLIYYALAGVRISLKYLLSAGLVILVFVFSFDLLNLLLERILVGDSNALFERGLYLGISKEMFLENIWGVGAGNFTTVMQDYVDLKLMPWLFQPVHNIFLLVLNELGILGGIGFVGAFVYSFVLLLGMLRRKRSDAVFLLMSMWLGIFAIGVFDHYMLSLYQGMFLIFLYFALVALRFELES